MSLGRAMSDKALALEEQISFVCVPNGLPATSDDEDRRRSHLGQQQQQQQQGISTNSVVCEQVEDCSDKSSDSGIDMPQVSMMLGMLKRTLSDEEEGGGGAVMVDGTEQSLMAVLSPSPVDDEEEDEEEEERIKYFLQCFDEKVDRKTLTVEALELLRLIPDGYVPLPHQVGGHRHVDGKLGILRHADQKDILYKPVPPNRGELELQFYESLHSNRSSCTPPGDYQDSSPLKELIPRYLGTHCIIDRAGTPHKYLKLEDIVSRFCKPSIMDVKVGRRVWEDFEQDMIDREEEFVGFRIIGMRVYRSSLNSYEYFDKKFGKSQLASTTEGALAALNHFFTDGEASRADLVDPIVERLQNFLHWMEQQRLFRLISASLLIVYEGDKSRPITDPRDLLDIRLVDFTRLIDHSSSSASSSCTSSCREGLELDHNTLFCLRNFIKCLKELKCQSCHR